MRFMFHAGVTLFAVMFATPALAQFDLPNLDIVNIDTKADQPTLSLSIIGTAVAKPDIAIITAGVDTSDASSNGAITKNNVIMARVIAAAKAQGLADKDIQTASIGIAQQFDYPDDKPPVSTGYQASNRVTIRIRDITKASAMYDTLAANGANNLSGPRFAIDDMESLKMLSRKDALVKAQNLSDFYAKSLGYARARLIAVGEGRSMDVMGIEQASYEVAADTAKAVATPV